jgi:hypothetical protein
MSIGGIRSVYLTDNGTSSGANNLAVNGSSTPVPYWVGPPASDRAGSDGFSSFHVERVIFHIEDSGAFTTVDFGAISNGLTNGCGFDFVSTSTTVDLLDGYPLKTNGDLVHYMYDIRLDAWGGGNGGISARWSFFKIQNDGAGMVLESGEKLQFTINDDLTGLVDFHIIAQGAYI